MISLPNDEQLVILNKIFLSTNRSGIGLTSSLKASKAAFIGSISLSAHWLSKIIPDLSTETIREEKAILSLPTFIEYNNILNQFKNEMPNKLNNINIISIWEKQFSKIQHIISSENQNITLKQIETNFPEQSTITPYSRYSQYSQEDKNNTETIKISVLML